MGTLATVTEQAMLVAIFKGQAHEKNDLDYRCR